MKPPETPDDRAALGLALETSGSQGGGACLMQGEKVLDEVDLGREQRSAQTLIPEIQQMLERSAAEVQEIQWIALNQGPGSFTGLRVGMTLAKVFAYSTGAALVACGAVEALAMQALRPETEELVVVLDAQRRQFFWQRCRPIPQGVQLVGDIAIADDTTIVEALQESTRLTGPGLPKLLKKQPMLQERTVSSDDWELRPHIVGTLGFRDWKAGVTIDPFELRPLYVRPSAAEEVYQRNHAGDSTPKR